ncbi:unnamed protein product [Symbiodinium pilosum]|uniref:PDZ domain-containing protein n=1 Tax=Symbiodinium pilosum TaxID=2952 RepID=A0A812XFE2_SYMPI|nr:unnamed protein product [Symbiodinium pilosum]
MIRASSERAVGRHGGSTALRATLSCASLASSGLFTETLMSRRSCRSASLSPTPQSRGHGRCYSPRRFASRHVPTAAEELAQHSQVLEPSVIKRFDGLMRHLKRNTDKQDFEKQVLASPPDVLVPEEYDEVLRGEFARHCSFGERLNTELMHSGKWVKMLKELGFVPGQGKAKGPCLSSLADADIIFQRVLHDTDYGGKRLTYDFFCKALCLVAVNMYPNLDWEAAMGELLQRMAAAAEEFQEQSGSNEPADFSLDPNVLLVLDHFKPKLHDLFSSFARRQLQNPMDARTGTGTTRLKERSIWKHTQDTIFASRASSMMLGGTIRDDVDPLENQDESMSPGLPAVKEVEGEANEAATEVAPEPADASRSVVLQDGLDPNPEASLPHQVASVASPSGNSPERRRRPQLPSGALQGQGSGFLSKSMGSASGQSLLAWAEHKGLCSPVSPDSRRSTMSSRAGKWSPVQDPYTYACGSPTIRNRRSFMSLEQLFALCKELKIMPDLMSRQALVRIFKRAQCAGSASAHGGSNFGYLSQEDDKEIPPTKLVTSDEVLPASSSSVAHELTVGARPPKEECFTFSVDVVRSPGTSFGVDISAAGKVCMVNAVQAGSLVGDWNNQCAPEHRIRQYDRLMAFNDDRPSKGKEMLEKLRDASGPVTITVQRPVVQQVTVSKSGKDLGLGVIDGQSFLLVTRIAEGAINDHNLAATSDQVIKVPSRIVTVDGKKGSGAELLKMMETSPAGFTAFVDAMGRIAIQAYTEEPYCDEYPEPHEKILAFLSDRLPGQIRAMRESFRYGCSGRGPAVAPGYIGRGLRGIGKEHALPSSFFEVGAESKAEGSQVDEKAVQQLRMRSPG